MDLNQSFNLEDEEILHEEHEDIENIQVEEEYEDMVEKEIGSNVEQPENGENELEQGELPEKPFEKSPKGLRNIARVAYNEEELDPTDVQQRIDNIIGIDEEPEYQVEDEVSESDEELETNIGEKELRTLVEKD